MTRFATAVALAAVAVAASAGSSLATTPQPQTFETIGLLTGPNTVAGTWTATGFVEDAGTYTETFRFAGETIHGEKVLVGAKGTIVLRLQAVVVWTSPCTATFRAGSWQIAEGTGSYARLKGGGTPLSEPGESLGDVCTGAVHVVHRGAAHEG